VRSSRNLTERCVRADEAVRQRHTDPEAFTGRPNNRDRDRPGTDFDGATLKGVPTILSQRRETNENQTDHRHEFEKHDRV
jgi:hypothetical protein